MPTMDSTAKAAVDSGAFAPAFFIWLDLVGGPLRVTTAGKDIPFAATGDSDLDGNTFTAFGGSLIDVGDVSNSESGSDTLTVQLSGIVSIDTALLAEIGDRTKWQGRTCRLWTAIYDVNGTTQQGAIIPYYTGYMSSVKLLPSPKLQSIQLTVENYLSALNDPSNRSYLGQKDYDSTDTSAAATLAAANGTGHGKGGVGQTYQGGDFNGFAGHTGSLALY